MPVHLVLYSARLDTDGEEQGVARVRITDRLTAQDCFDSIPGFMTGIDLGPEPLYVLTYSTPRGTVDKRLSSSRIRSVGTAVMRLAAGGNAWDIRVTDESGRAAAFAVFRVG
ncbi:hypothetical protein [Streptomyces sp. CAU 1734]|uniref:hypothetical protein n=1 Tax=Streptomyces sp. CAU 1734 TaxID=3140360 RepID=UPI003261BE55